MIGPMRITGVFSYGRSEIPLRWKVLEDMEDMQRLQGMEDMQDMEDSTL